MTTLGARGCPNLEGVAGPDEPPLPALLGPAAPGCPPNCGAPVIGPAAPVWPGCSEPVVGWVPSAAGCILARASASCVCEEEGVGWFELEGELDAPAEGDAMPEVESFFLDDLLPSLALASCSC